VVLEKQSAERFEREADEDLNSAFEFRVDSKKESALVFVVAVKGDWIGDAPMRGYGFSRPQRADFSRGVVAYGKHEIVWRTVRAREFIPALTAEP
jgi:hypothetical protein